MQLKDFGKTAHLSELTLKFRMRCGEPPQSETGLGPQQREAYIDSHENHGHQWWIDQGTVLLQKSDAKMPKTLTVVWLVRDPKSGAPWRHWPYKTYHTVTVSV